MNTVSAEDRSKFLPVAIEAANRASEVIRTRRKEESVSISLKGARNLVTTTDIEAEKIIIDFVRANFPDHLILAEESEETVAAIEYGRQPVWVIDPIDGTTNFAHEHYQVGVSIACAIGGEVQTGVVQAPFLGETFTAVRGGGAYLNGAPIRVTTTTSLEDALVATGFPYIRTNIPNICRRLERMLSTCRDVRRLGAASLDIAWVACGRLDCFYEETLMPWDGAAACLIAREAGALISHYPYDSDTQRRTVGYPGELFMDNLIVATPGIMTAVESLLKDA